MTKSPYKVQGISFPDPALFAAAKTKAAADRRSLSNYIVGLIENDLRSAGLWPPPASLSKTKPVPIIHARTLANRLRARREAHARASRPKHPQNPSH